MHVMVALSRKKWDIRLAFVQGRESSNPGIMRDKWLTASVSFGVLKLLTKPTSVLISAILSLCSPGPCHTAAATLQGDPNSQSGGRKLALSIPFKILLPQLRLVQLRITFWHMGAAW
jgi:hypothetical protein